MRAIFGCGFRIGCKLAALWLENVSGRNIGARSCACGPPAALDTLPFTGDGSECPGKVARPRRGGVSGAARTVRPLGATILDMTDPPEAAFRNRNGSKGRPSGVSAEANEELLNGARVLVVEDEAAI